MRRIGLAVALAVGLTLAPLAAGAQQTGTQSRVGLISLSAKTPGSAGSGLEALRQRLRDLGYIEGQNLSMEYRFAEGRRDNLLLLARDLVTLKLDVIVTFGTPATIAIRDATNTTPIVFIGVGDPIGSGFAASLARPGGNLTGFSFVGPELAAKNLELLKQAVPHATRVAVLSPGDPNQPLARNVLSELDRSAQVLGITLERLQVEATVDQLENALALVGANHPDALLTLNDPLFFLHRRRILDSTAKLRLPTMFQTKEYAYEGGLMAYVPNVVDQFRRAAEYVDKILKGTMPADLPVEQPTKFELVINLKTAKALGLTIPQSLLLRADQVIE